MPARLPVLVRGRARRSCRPAAATRRAPPRTLPHQGSLTHPVSCWHGLAPRLPSTRFIPTPLCTCPAPTPPPPRPQKVSHRTRRSRNDLRYAPLYTWANLRPLRAQLRTLLHRAEAVVANGSWLGSGSGLGLGSGLGSGLMLGCHGHLVRIRVRVRSPSPKPQP